MRIVATGHRPQGPEDTETTSARLSVREQCKRVQDLLAAGSVVSGTTRTLLLGVVEQTKKELLQPGRLHQDERVL